MAQAVLERTNTTEAILAKNGLEGYSKVSQEGGSTCTLASFYNPDTKDYQSFIVRDFTFCNDDLYNVPVDEEVRRMWLHGEGQILVGDLVVVTKGRGVRLGTVAYVKAIKPCFVDGVLRDRYVYLSNGERTYLRNVRLARTDYE